MTQHTRHTAYAARTAADLSCMTDGQIDRQTPRTSVRIVCTSCIRCRLTIQISRQKVVSSPAEARKPIASPVCLCYANHHRQMHTQNHRRHRSIAYMPLLPTEQRQTKAQKTELASTHSKNCMIQQSPQWTLQSP